MATLESEMDAAIAGGVTSLACPPDTDPPLDEPGLVDMLQVPARQGAEPRARLSGRRAHREARRASASPRWRSSRDAGCVAFSQADAPLADTQVLWRALQYAATFGFPVWLRAAGRVRSREAASRTTARSRRASGLPGIPAFAETVALGDASCELVRATGARVHLCRLSSAGGVEHGAPRRRRKACR